MIDELCGPGWALIDSFLEPAQARAIYEYEKSAWERGLFRAGRVGQVSQQASSHRSDQIRWVDDQDSSAHLAFLHSIDELMARLRQELRLPVKRREFHASVYESGAHYEKHLDVFRGERSFRQVSCVYYLNSNWTESDGGELRLHLPDGEQSILPKANRLVVFRSRDILHEVKPPTKARFALAGWLRSDE